MMTLPIFTLKRNPKRKISRPRLKPILVLVFISLFILQLVTCPLWGQVMQKKQLTESDYAKWGELYFDKISPNGQWISYRMLYHSGLDTLFVRNTSTLKTYNFPKGSFPSFLGNEHLSYGDVKSRHILNLVTGTTNSYPKNTRIVYSSQCNKIIIHLKQDQNLQLLNVLDNSVKTIDNVTDFTMSPTGKNMALAVCINKKYAVGLMDLKGTTATQWIIKDTPNPPRNFAWDKHGRAIAFNSSSDTDPNEVCLYFYTLATKKLLSLNSKEKNTFPGDKVFDKDLTYPLDISDDLQRVFFGLRPKTVFTKKNKDSVEVWQTDDKWIYPMEQRSGLFEQKPVLAAWTLSTDSIIQITSPKFPKVMLTGDKACAIISNPKQYEPQFEDVGPRDFYIMDLKTGKSEILVRKQSEYYGDLLPSPSGKYIAYFKDNSWWVYDIKAKKHTNIIKNIAASFSFNSLVPDRYLAYGNTGWSMNDKEILLYDQFDIWAIKPDGSVFKRLTQGKEKQVNFKINTKGNFDLLSKNYDAYKSQNIDLNIDLILRAEGENENTGFYSWNAASGAKQIVYTDRFIDNIQVVKGTDRYIYQEQNQAISPRLVVKGKESEEKIIFQSNPQQQEYHWGISKLLDFHNSKKNVFKGILYYPSNYNPDKKYPMIVRIYEKQSSRFNRYVNPSLFVNAGYNPTVLASKGYFVLCPDIEQETGKVGEVAVDCTVSAVKQIIDSGLVDPKKIGLIGHSFGGYEANFIITQTDLFATAVAGASISDLNSFYLSVGWDLNISDMTRFINGQWRMGKTPFEDPELYIKNSPITHVANIKTPLLIWAGKADWHVNWNQSIEYYMALRRLEKKGTMLLYPNEKHTITQPKNQKDLSKRVCQWFDYYLKNDSSIPWISNEIN